MLPLSAVMAIVSTPRHQQKLNGRYLSSAPEYVPAFLERLREVTGGLAFWDPARK